MDEIKTGIQKAVDAAGSQRKLAEALGVKQGSLWEWVERGYVPNARVAQIAELYDIDAKELMDPALRASL